MKKYEKRERARRAREWNSTRRAVRVTAAKFKNSGSSKPLVVEEDLTEVPQPHPLELTSSQVAQAARDVSEPDPMPLHWTVWFLVLAGATITILFGFFMERDWGAEEQTLFNIPYTFLHEGKVAFPAYGYWYESSYDRLFVHPPTHYLEVGLLMKAGLPLYYAEAVPLVFLSIVCLVLVAKARFSAASKLGLLAGLIFAIAWLGTISPIDFSYHLRPDATLAFSLLAGFLALQASRLQHWEGKRLFIGSLLITYGSITHYTGLVAWLGLFPALAVAWRDLPLRRFVSRVVYAATAACLVGLPYLFFHLLPNLQDLQRYSGYVSLAKLWQTIAQNFVTYREIYGLFTLNVFPSLIYALPLKLILMWSIPPFMLGVLLLLGLRQARVFALSSLPFTCFLFFISGRKMSPYYDVDCILVILATWMWIAAGWNKAASFLPHWTRAAAAPAFGCLVVGLLGVGTPALALVSVGAHEHEFFTLRALAKQIVGPNATVASIHPAWFVSGATRWFDLTRDLLLGVPLSAGPIDPHTYWSRFDAVVMPHESAFGTNSGETEATLYTEGIVRFRGFLESRMNPHFRWIWMSPRKDRPPRGFLWRTGKLLQFSESPSGNYVVVSAVMPATDEVIRKIAPLEYWELDMPKNASGGAGDLVFLLMQRDAYQHQHAFFEQYPPIEVVAGSLTPVDPAAFPRTPIEQDTIRFYRSYGELLSSMAEPVPGINAEFLEFSAVNDNRVSGKTDGEAFRVAADPVEWDQLAIAKIPHVIKGHDYRISLDMNLEKGAVVFGVSSGSNSKALASVYQVVPGRGISKKFVFHASTSAPLFLSLRAWIGRPSPVTVAISNPVVQEVKLIR